MPIYEYQCPKCGTVFEDWVHISDAPETRPCPKCGTAAPHIISNTSFVLKGGGWYVTDYGYRKNVSDTGSEGGAAPAPHGDGEGAATGTDAPEAQTSAAQSSAADAPVKAADKKAAKADAAPKSGSGKTAGKAASKPGGKSAAKGAAKG